MLDGGMHGGYLTFFFFLVTDRLLLLTVLFVGIWRDSIDWMVVWLLVPPLNWLGTRLSQFFLPSSRGIELPRFCEGGCMHLWAMDLIWQCCFVMESDVPLLKHHCCTCNCGTLKQEHMLCLVLNCLILSGHVSDRETIVCGNTWGELCACLISLSFDSECVCYVLITVWGIKHRAEGRNRWYVRRGILVCAELYIALVSSCRWQSCTTDSGVLSENWNWTEGPVELSILGLRFGSADACSDMAAVQCNPMLEIFSMFAGVRGHIAQTNKRRGWGWNMQCIEIGRAGSDAAVLWFWNLWILRSCHWRGRRVGWCGGCQPAVNSCVGWVGLPRQVETGRRLPWFSFQKFKSKTL